MYITQHIPLGGEYFTILVAFVVQTCSKGRERMYIEYRARLKLGRFFQSISISFQSGYDPFLLSFAQFA